MISTKNNTLHDVRIIIRVPVDLEPISLKTQARLAIPQLQDVVRILSL